MSASHDIYAPIHKALRVALGDLVARLGRMDPHDQTQRTETLAALRAQLRFSEAHLRHEEVFIHPALCARAPEAVDALERDHAGHRADFQTLEHAIATLEAARPEARAAAAHKLYLAFTLFVAEDFAHMAEEERTTNPLLQSLFTDAELQAMEAAIVGSMPPEESMAALAGMIPAMNRSERAAFLSFVRETAPPEAFSAMIQVAARPTLAANDWTDLADRLGLAA